MICMEDPTNHLLIKARGIRSPVCRTSIGRSADAGDGKAASDGYKALAALFSVPAVNAASVQIP